MIGIIFEFINEKIEVRIDGENVLFRTHQFGGAFTTIDNLKLDKKGVIKEFPELEGNNDWRKEAIKRFKMKVKTLKTEKERMGYIIDDLSKFGYVPLYIQKKGSRPIKL